MSDRDKIAMAIMGLTVTIAAVILTAAGVHKLYTLLTRRKDHP